MEHIAHVAHSTQQCTLHAAPSTPPTQCRYATWDLAFHCVAFAHVDPDFAKDQLILFLREWYMHPNGALPAYEWNFSDVNPPVHAWAAWQVYRVRILRSQIPIAIWERSG